MGNILDQINFYCTFYWPHSFHKISYYHPPLWHMRGNGRTVQNLECTIQLPIVSIISLYSIVFSSYSHILIIFRNLDMFQLIVYTILSYWQFYSTSLLSLLKKWLGAASFEDQVCSFSQDWRSSSREIQTIELVTVKIDFRWCCNNFEPIIHIILFEIIGCR